MAHYAFLDDNNVVTEVIVGKDESELIDGLTPEQWYADYRGQTCVRTSYNSKIRFNYASIGMTYDKVRDAFIPIKCHAEAVLDESIYNWNCSNEAHNVIS